VIDVVDAVLARHGRKHVGLVAAIQRGDETVVTGRVIVSYDRLDAPEGEAIFELGSITKVFTATLLAEAVVWGEVALPDPHVGAPGRAAGAARQGAHERAAESMGVVHAGAPARGAPAHEAEA
jgi:serine-type D-Ala-D-Ala carboxypeptidase/endopeptidase